jgi:hypothetical protein
MFHQPRGSLSFYLGHKHTRRFNSANMRVIFDAKILSLPSHGGIDAYVPPAGR